MRQDRRKAPRASTSAGQATLSDQEILDRAARIISRSPLQPLNAHGGATDELHQIEQVRKALAPKLVAPELTTYTQNATVDTGSWVLDPSVFDTVDTLPPFEPSYSLGTTCPNGITFDPLECDGWQAIEFPPSIPVVNGQAGEIHHFGCGAADKNWADGPATPDSDHNDNLVVDGDNQHWVNVGFPSMKKLTPPTDATHSDTRWLPNDPAREAPILQQAGSLNHMPQEPETTVATSNEQNKAPARGQQKSRQPFSSQVLREETSATRKLKACVRCQMQKTRVSKKGVS